MLCKILMHLHMLSCARCSRPCAHTADTSACKDSRRHVTHMVACQVLGYLGGHACRLFASCAYVKRVYVCLLPCTLNCRRCALVGALPLYNTVCGNSIRPDDHLQAGSILTHKHTHHKHRQTLRQAGMHTQTYPCPSCTPCPLPRALPCVSQRLSFLGTHPPAHATVFGTRPSLSCSRSYFIHPQRIGWRRRAFRPLLATALYWLLAIGHVASESRGRVAEHESIVAGVLQRNPPTHCA
jgi:hypothetical protein